MTVGAQLSVTDQRRMARHPVDHPVIAEHFGKGDVHLHIANVSSNGFMIDNAEDIARGERVIVMADAAEQADEIDLARAEAAREKAAQAIEDAPADADTEKALAALRRAEIRLKVAKRRRSR